MTTDPDCLPGRNLYDPRVSELACATGNADLFPELKVPKSTLRGWLNGQFRTAVGTESVTRTEIELYSENAKLRRRVRVVQAVMCQLLVLIRVLGCRLELGSALKVIGLSHSYVVRHSGVPWVQLHQSQFPLQFALLFMRRCLH
jgi:hypothetical protein